MAAVWQAFSAVRGHLKVTRKQTADDETKAAPVLAYSFCHVERHAADSAQLSVLLFVY